MQPIDTSRDEDVAGGDNQASDDQETQFKPRASDRRGEGGLFGGYSGPDRRSGSERRANA